MTDTSYATNAAMMERVLDTSGSYNSSLYAAGQEASLVVDMFLKPYFPYTDAAGNEQIAGQMSTPDDLIKVITADLAISIFKRRMMPEDVTIKGQLAPDSGQVEMDARGWFGQGMAKLEQYIRSYCVLGQAVTSINNPDYFMELYNKKLITAEEARAWVTKASTVTKDITEILTKTLNDVISRTVTETLTKTETDIKDEYHTKRQKSFVWIKGDHNMLHKYKQER